MLMHQNERRTAMIFAAGLGTRLKPITDFLPKALVPIADKTLLTILLERLQLAGFTDVVINVHHFAEKIEDFIAEHPFALKIHLSDERSELLETGGGIRHASSLLGTTPFLVHNVDILSNLDIASFFKAHQTADLATVLVSQRKTTRYLLFDDTNRLVGWRNSATGEVRSPHKNLHLEACKELAFAGVHTLSPHVLQLMQTCPDRFSIIDFYLSMADKYTIRGYEQPNLDLLDVGKLDVLEQAELFYRRYY